MMVYRGVTVFLSGISSLSFSLCRVYVNTFFFFFPCSNSSSPNHQGDGTSQGSGDVSVCFLVLIVAAFAQRHTFDLFMLWH